MSELVNKCIEIQDNTILDEMNDHPSAVVDHMAMSAVIKTVLEALQEHVQSECESDIISFASFHDIELKELHPLKMRKDRVR